VGLVLGVIALVIAGVEFLAGSHGNSTASTTKPNIRSTATGAATKDATPSAGPKASATHKPTARKKTGYLLAAPGTAGGYARLTPVPSYVRGPAGSTAQAVRGSVVSNGGKVTSKLAAAYQLSGGQVMTFTGYEGTFSPAKVIASLSTLGMNVHTYTAGKDGGKLACAVTSGTQSGTFCVWVTSTTLGVTEFFSSVGPEAVSNQSKTASDTLNFRNDVEHR
jgi:hypothetical protein